MPRDQTAEPTYIKMLGANIFLSYPLGAIESSRLNFKDQSNLLAKLHGEL